MTDTEFKFEVGDEVEAFGVMGVVKHIYDSTNEFAIQCRFEYGETFRNLAFMKDGRLQPWHKTPSLKLIKRKPKPLNFEMLVQWSGPKSMPTKSMRDLHDRCMGKDTRIKVEEIVDEQTDR